MRSESMLGRQKDYAAMRRFEDRGIFHSPHYIFHLSSLEVAVPTSTNEKCNMANGKSKTITPQYFLSLLMRQQRWRVTGERCAFPRRRRLRFPGLLLRLRFRDHS